MANLYNVQGEYLRIMEMIEDADGEITENIEGTFERLKNDRDEVINAMLQQIKNEEFEEAMLKTEMERLNARKADAIKRQERLKKATIEALKFFDMRSSTKGSKGYAFKNHLFSCFTVTRQSYLLDEITVAEKFKPITGEVSKFINYSVSTKFNADKLKKINDTGLVPATDFSLVVDKSGINEYMKQSAIGLQLEFDSDNKIKLDPIADLITLQLKDSLTIR